MPVAPPVSDRPLRAILYARVSKGEGAGAQEVESQLGALRPWAASRGWVVVAEEADRVTGDPVRRKHREPPGLRRALRALEERQADVLAVFAADRLVRSPMALLSLVSRLQSLGVHVASYNDGADLDTTTEFGELFLFLRGWMSRMEVRLIRARTRAGLARARAEGKTLGRPRAELGHYVAQLAEGRRRGASWNALAKLAKAWGLEASPATIRRRTLQALRN